jgi:putative spermidine/putrescine transport system permease protein
MQQSIEAGRFVKLVGVLVSVFLLGPLVIVAGMSVSKSSGLAFPPDGIGLQWYEEFAASSLWRDAFSLSLRLGLIVAAISTVLGYAVALGLHRSGTRLKPVGLGVVMLPLVVPTIVVGVAMYLVFSSWHIVGTLPAVIAAHVALAMPYVVVNVLSSLQMVGPEYERAAVSLGAHPIRAFCRTTLPLTLPGVVAGAIFAFITSWDEVVVAIFVTGPETETLPMVMWSQMRSELDPTIAAVATSLMAVTIVGLALGAGARALMQRPIKTVTEETA